MPADCSRINRFSRCLCCADTNHSSPNHASPNHSSSNHTHADGSHADRSHAGCSRTCKTGTTFRTYGSGRRT